MQVVLLSAGNSSRFYPFIKYGHKSFIALFGYPIIYHTLKSIEKTGLTDVIIAVNNVVNSKKLLSSCPPLDLKITFVEQKEALGMGDALLCVKQYIKGEFFLLHGHHIEFNLFKQLLENEKKTANQIVLLAKHEEQIEHFGALVIDGNKVKDIIEKPKKEEAPSQLKVVGIYLLSKLFLETLNKIPLEHYHLEKAFTQYAVDNLVTFIETKEDSVSLKYPWDMFTIIQYLFKQQKPHIASDVVISKNVTIEGNVVIESGTKIFENACIKGPVYIGKNVIVGNNSIIRNNSVIGDNCVIGANMEMTKTIILNNSTTHSGFIGDSIIGSNTKIAAGICTGNVRLDRQNVKVKLFNSLVPTSFRHFGVIIGDNVNFGIRVSSMPGSIVGNDVIVGPNTLIMQNIPDKTKFYTRFENTVSENIEITAK